MDVWERLDAQERVIMELKGQLSRIGTPPQIVTNGAAREELQDLRRRLDELSNKLATGTIRQYVREEVTNLVAKEAPEEKIDLTGPTKEFSNLIIVPSILKHTQQHFHAKFLNKSRKDSVVTARHVAVYLIRELTPLSFPEIGVVLDRHHTTAIYAYQHTAQRIKANPHFGDTVNSIKQQVIVETEGDTNSEAITSEVDLLATRTQGG